MKFKDNPQAVSRTRQEYRQVSNINSIMKKARQVGALPAIGNRQPLFMDVSNAPDFERAMNSIKEADRTFMMLPSEVRKRFDNSPLMMVKFLCDSKNRDEAIRLGLVKAPPRTEPSSPGESPAPGGKKTGDKSE